MPPRSTIAILCAAAALALSIALARREMVASSTPLPHTITGGAAMHAPYGASQQQEIVVSEGTSMAVAVSRDGTQLAIDLQGSIWVLPSSGGEARRVTDIRSDARHPVWSPDGAHIAYQGYRAGNYDIWLAAADGSGERQITTGVHDDREPAWSHDGTRIAFSSDRAQDGNYDIWIADLASGAVHRLTTDPSNDFFPSWSPGDSAIAFTSARGGSNRIWSISLTDRTERLLLTDAGSAEFASFSPSGEVVHYTGTGGAPRFQSGGRILTEGESVFPFRPSFAPGGVFYYTADGVIRRRTLSDPSPPAATVPFTARLAIARPPAPVAREEPYAGERRALGIVAPTLSPDARNVAFAALGDIWVLPLNGDPYNITDDEYMDAEPAWSRDGRYIAYSTDRGGALMDIWIHDTQTGVNRQLTRTSSSAMSAAWSPDGTQIAFLEVDGLWRRAAVAVADAATGEVRRLRGSAFGPGAPTWSADGSHVVVATLVPYSTRFREGLNHIMSIPVRTAGDPVVIAPLGDGGLDSRSGAGPAWSPDGRTLALVHAGMLHLVPVDEKGHPAGPSRVLSRRLAHAPSWSGDSRSVLVQSMDSLVILDVASGAETPVPLDLRWEPWRNDGLTVIHGGGVFDGLEDLIRPEMDVVIRGNRIVAVEQHSDHLHVGAQVVDATGLTVAPGLMEYHTHLQKDMGSKHLRSYLAFGITSVRSPGSTPYEGVEDREAVQAGVLAGPRLFVTGYLFEWERSYYKMSVAIADSAHLKLELQRAAALQHDMLKSYVRMPDAQQEYIAAFAHSLGIPASSHEIFPAAAFGMDGVEHTTGTSRRGFSPKVGAQQRSYSDVTSIIGAARMTFSPTLTLSATWLQRLLAAEPELRGDPRFLLLPPWVRPAGTGGAGRAGGGGGGGGGGGAQLSPLAELILRASASGALIVAGTDTPNPANLHAELRGYHEAGMSPFQAIQTATTNPAAALALDAGAIVPGMLADLIVIDGNPLEDLSALLRIRYTIANGRVYPIEELMRH